MPRIGLKALLADLQASGVRRYVKDGERTEVEFWSPPGAAVEEPAEDDETRRETRAAPEKKDPLRAALADEPFPLDGDEAEAN